MKEVEEVNKVTITSTTTTTTTMTMSTNLAGGIVMFTGDMCVLM